MGRFDALTQIEEERKNELPRKPNAAIKSEQSVLVAPTKPTTESTRVNGVPVRVPPPVPRTVRGTGPLIPKSKRAIRQRQPFDIYEDQYERLKKIAESEREFVNGRGMSQMVREAIDNYLKGMGSSNKL
jgi:hypothetical protein